jgi:hypothetical protein
LNHPTKKLPTQQKPLLNNNTSLTSGQLIMLGRKERIRLKSRQFLRRYCTRASLRRFLKNAIATTLGMAFLPAILLAELIISVLDIKDKDKRKRVLSLAAFLWAVVLFAILVLVLAV